MRNVSKESTNCGDKKCLLSDNALEYATDEGCGCLKAIPIMQRTDVLVFIAGIRAELQDLKKEKADCGGNFHLAEVNELRFVLQHLQYPTRFLRKQPKCLWCCWPENKGHPGYCRLNNVLKRGTTKGKNDERGRYRAPYRYARR